MLKKAICLIFAFLLSINSFAAVVSDSDGSAFVTKAEFDALKKDFVDQIDNYNTSIDYKIDGAIASYLSGISLQEKHKEKVICYDEDGILSPRANNVDLNWSEGMMKCDLYGIGTYWTTDDLGGDSGVGCGQQWTELKGLDYVDFYELGIRDIDYTNNNARWTGRWRTRQFAMIYGYDVIWNSFLSSSSPTDAGLNYGFKKLENIDNLIEYNSDRQFFWVGFGTSANYTKGIGGPPKWCNIKRFIYENTNDNIICTPTSVTTTRFSDFDNFRDWCNDTDSSGHTVMQHADELFASGLFKWQNAITPNTRKMTYREGTFNLNILPWNNWSGIPDSYYWKPYMGFSTKVKNYNQLWTNSYDNLIGTLLEYDSSTQYVTDKNGVKHLWISAGAPVVEVKKDDIVVIECSFNDAVDHDLWIKIGAFDKTKEANNDDCIMPSYIHFGEDLSSPTATVGSMNKSIKISSGTTQKVTFECEQKGVVFLKWSISGNSGAGGGTFMPPETVSVTSTR